jgi:hypothetical protein
MPMHLVERINASLAAEQEQRTSTDSGAAVRPLLATARRRRARGAFVVAGAAAAVAAIAMVGSSAITARQGTTVSSASIATSAGSGAERLASPPSAAGQTQPRLPRAAAAKAVLQIRLSGTRYTRTGFVAQVETLRRSAVSRAEPQPDQGSGVGPAGTAAGLRECLVAIGAGDAQAVRADVAFYDGQPAVVIVVTVNGVPMAYAVGRECSSTGAALLRPATPLS